MLSEQTKPSEMTIAHDDKPLERDLKATIEERRAAADQEARTKLAGRLPAGCMVRTDDEPKDAPKPVIDEGTARRLLNAVADLSEKAGLTARADEDVKNVVTEPKPPEGKADDQRKDEDKDKEPTLADVMGAIDKMNKRMDGFEKRNRRDDDDDDEPSDEGKPVPVAADDDSRRSLRRRRRIERADAALCDFHNEDRFADFQSRADAVASLFGQKAAKPISGETLGAFKRRLVRPWQSLSPTCKDVDLKVLGVADGIAFNVAVDDILKCARAEGERPTRVPTGYLAERVEHSRAGHTITKFYGMPKSWMSQFAPRGAVVKRINRLDHEGNVNGVAYQRAEGR
jgi:hypothetical protein